jgi:broad specificity phosphatase PhoE
LSFVYFIRHAQAGSRDNYDVLSDAGREQARLLGEHFASHRIELSAVYSGSMRRQNETAAIACEVIARSGLPVPEITVEKRLDEFSLISVYRALAKRMMKEDEAFERDIREMQEIIAGDPHATGGAVGRCDQAVIRAWIENRYPDYEGESWINFKTRVQVSPGDLNLNGDSGTAVAVFTSATPVAIHAAAALGLPDEKLLNILGVIYNSSISVLRMRGGESRLFTFNSTPHLPPALRTFR